MNNYWTKNYILLGCLILILTSVQCNRLFSPKNINEGHIVFNITYLDDIKENHLIALLPSSMTLKFKENRTVSHIEGFFGSFRLTYISDFNSGKNYSLFRILDKKYMYVADTVDEPFGYKDMKNIKIIETTETDTIAGYLCHKAIADCKAISDTPIILYYTYEIDIENPNTNNPFRQIKGVLLAFQVKLVDINMRFRAEKVVREEVDESEFLVPEGFNNVSKEELELMIDNFNNNSEKTTISK